MDHKSTRFVLLSVLLTLTAGAIITKLEGIEGRAKFIETDSNSNAYIVTSTALGENFYVLNSNNLITFQTKLKSIIRLQFNSKNQIYLFDQVENNLIRVGMFDPQSATITNLFGYFSYTSDFPTFFDNDDNLFFDTSSGIGILRHNETQPIIINKLASYNIINNLTHAVDPEGNVFLGLTWNGSKSHRAVVITQEEIYKPNPSPYFLNFYSYGNIQEMAPFKNSIAFATSNELLILRSGNFYTINARYGKIFNNLLSTNERIFYQYDTCILYFVTQSFKNVLVKNFFGCELVQTADNEGNAFFAMTIPEGSVYTIRKNETDLRKIYIPNSLIFYGIETTANGNVWILAQDLYFIAGGSTNAVKKVNLPYSETHGPLKVKTGSDDVFIGFNDGIYFVSK